MNIAVVTPYFNPAWNVVEYAICEQLVNLGNQVFLITSDESIPQFGDINPQENLLNFQVIRLPTLMNFWESPILLGIQKSLSKIHLDLVNAQEYFQPCSISAYKFCKSNKIPFVYTQHLNYHIKGVKGKIFQVYEKNFCQNVKFGSDGIICLTTEARDYLAKSGVVDSNTTIIPPGINTGFFKPSRGRYLRDLYNIPDRESIILSVARLHPSKRIDLIIKAFYLVEKKLGKAKLVIVGRGRSSEKLKNLATHLSLDDDIIFHTDFIPRNVMPIVYSESTLFVLPSSFEPFGLACLEAMSCGLPVIGSAVGGLKDLIEDEKNGFLLTDSSPESLANFILLLLQEDGLRKSFGEESRKRSVKLFDWRVIGNRLQDFFKYLTVNARS